MTGLPADTGRSGALPGQGRETRRATTRAARQTSGIEARRSAALRALTQRPTAISPVRFPAETQPSGDLPNDPILAARIHDARDHGIDDWGHLKETT